MWQVSWSSGQAGGGDGSSRRPSGGWGWGWVLSSLSFPSNAGMGVVVNALVLLSLSDARAGGSLSSSTLGVVVGIISGGLWTT